MKWAWRNIGEGQDRCGIPLAQALEQPRSAAVLASRQDPIIWTGAELWLPLVTKSSGIAAGRQTQRRNCES